MNDITAFIWTYNREVAACLTFAAVAFLFAGIVLWRHGITKPYVLASIFGWTLVAISLIPIFTGARGWAWVLASLAFIVGLALAGLQQLVAVRRRERASRAV
ncbi:hypothetical protein [Paraburkholderia phytofirmans]|uniref:Transmembrane protein n=1 Tax=Paraburkholderia phytofirmans (strain DSM 17436 / LMG 22146 / PsJN) TaxID=398527 RepID=B2THB1_PARPJ|nr:hypothetical protein [Paraburkholderia phytofirmans]ACD21657.1 hypothetical protein Bphyt_7372 [Paraburkholderia phytofirmans PsJN]